MLQDNNNIIGERHGPLDIIKGLFGNRSNKKA
jgi:hypothetical protein